MNITDFTPSNFNILASFRATMRSFWDSYNELKANRNEYATHPQLAARYNALVSKAEGIRAKVEPLANAVDTAIAWVKENLGLGGRRRLEGLGIVPVVILGLQIAVVLSALYAVKGWVDEYLALKRDAAGYLAQYDDLRESGVSHSDAVAAINASTAASAASRSGEAGASTYGNIGNIVKWVAIAGGIYFVGSFLLASASGPARRPRRYA